MGATAKLFMNGSSQAVRLPAEYRFDGVTEVFVHRDPSGDVVLSVRPRGSWPEFYVHADGADIPPDFLGDRDTIGQLGRNLR